MLIKFVSSSYSNYGNFYTTYTSHTCRSFTYGKESCDKNCRCVKENTQFCDNINGECICKPGWTSGDCSTDVNECLGTNNKVCPPNSDCVNTKGSFRCECHLGYKLNVDTGKCEGTKVFKHTLKIYTIFPYSGTH
uniref:EGF-like domain-containing protein n=1 Tax=Biomphalaria glabrata TaxID=6526 RepID=A0A2C9M5M3_BIOGL